VADAIERVGEVPLPPYIRRVPGSRQAKRTPGATRRCMPPFRDRGGADGGLHFDEDLLRELGAVGSASPG